MANSTYVNENFSIVSGATGSFTFSAQAGNPQYPGGPGNTGINGTFNGQQITGFSSFGNPINGVEDLSNSAPGNAFVGTEGIIAEAGHVNDPSAANGLSLLLADGTSVHLFVQQDQAGNLSLAFATSTGGGGPIVLSFTQDTYTFGCFAAATLIRAAAGEVAVETLGAGDLVLTQTGEARPVRWVGHTVVHPHRSPEPWNLHPIRVRAGAVAEGVPCRDLRVSPGHALLIGDVLVNAGELVNGGTIVQEEVERVDYYHVELNSHDILIADGMPCESYLDDGNRASFLNGADHIRLHGRIDRASEATCRPLVRHGPLLVEARAALLARAIALGWRLEERPALRLALGDQLGDVALAPVAVAGRRAWFLLPDDAPATVRLRSAAAIVNRIAPDTADDRLLGVALGELRIDGEAVALDGGVFGTGFLPPEDDGTTAWRWTDGDAALHLPAGARMIEVALRIVLPTLRREEADAQGRLSSSRI